MCFGRSATSNVLTIFDSAILRPLKIRHLAIDDFRQRNFAPSDYQNEQGRDTPCFEMTRDGFSFLVMGFTGVKAAHWKEQYAQRTAPAARSMPRENDRCCLSLMSSLMECETMLKQPDFLSGIAADKVTSSSGSTRPGCNGTRR